jgi:hypothetical protein
VNVRPNLTSGTIRPCTLDAILGRMKRERRPVVRTAFGRVGKAHGTMRCIPCVAPFRNRKGRRDVSVRVMALVWDADIGTPTHKLVALKLADCANDRGESIYPSIATIVRDTELSRHAVTETLSAFRRDGLLVVTRRGGPRAGPTCYRMHLPWLHDRMRTPKVVPQGDYCGKNDVVPLGDQGSPPGGHKPSREPRSLRRKKDRGTSLVKGAAT